MSALAGVTLVVGAWAGCSDSSACASDHDCFGGEVCRGGSCLAVVDTDAGNQGGANNAHHDDAGTASDTSASNNGGAGDAGGSSDTGSNNGDAGLACEADPFNSTCQPDSYETNNTWTDSYHLDANTPFGCFSQFRSLDQTLDATLCATEQADFYDFMYNPCHDTAYYIDFDFEPKNECSAALVDFEFMNHACGDDPNVSCQELANGGRKIRFIVDASEASQSQAAYFSVTPASDQKVEVPYTLRVQIHQ